MIRFLLVTLMTLLFVACASFPERGGYDRSSGSYKGKKSVAQSQKKVEYDDFDEEYEDEAYEDDDEDFEDPFLIEEPVKPQKQEVKKPVAKPAPVPVKKPAKVASNSWERAYKPWLGVPYKYGGTTKKGVDCSGFVGNIYSEVRKMQLPRTSQAMYKGGKKISKSELREGDLVFFGSVWKIDHVGIYLNGDRFVHASSSRGVMISPMNDNYWSPRYQGARRY